jgi:hypothetical protein
MTIDLIPLLTASLPTAIGAFVLWRLKKASTKLENAVSKQDYDRFKKELKAITEAGIESGRAARKEQYKDIQENSKDISFMAGYLVNNNGFKPRPRKE